MLNLYFNFVPTVLYFVFLPFMNLNRRLKFLVLTDGSFDHASSRTRAVLYFQKFYNQFNCSIDWLPRIPVKGRTLIYSFVIFPFLKRLFFLKRLIFILFKKYDLVFIQRFFLPNYLLNLLKQKRINIIYDFDDAIYLDKPGRNENLKKTLRMLTATQHIIVSARELESFCLSKGFKNTTIISTPVDIERYGNKSIRVDSEITIGWIGSPYTTKFLLEIEEALSQIFRKYNVNILLIGAYKNFNFDDLPLDIVPWSYEKEPEYLSRIDIGIMPLPDEEYARGKGGYKLFQYMAAGIPIIASPIGINCEIVINNYNGFLAATTQDWIEYFSLLIEKPELRSKLGNHGKQIAEEKFSRNACFGQLSKIITELIR
jgi:glycosyltransferase involved in cell wall biosynthesis